MLTITGQAILNYKVTRWSQGDHIKSTLLNVHKPDEPVFDWELLFIFTDTEVIIFDKKGPTNLKMKVVRLSKNVNNNFFDFYDPENPAIETKITSLSPFSNEIRKKFPQGANYLVRMQFTA